MTTIAWDGKTLAADQCSWSGGVRRRVRKVFKIQQANGDHLLVALAGDAAFCMAVLAWLRGDGERPNPRDYWAIDEMRRTCAVTVQPSGKVCCLSNSLMWEEFDERVFANGAGHEFAWGALEAGATAVRAVEIALLRSDYAGFGVDAVTFDDAPAI